VGAPIGPWRGPGPLATSLAGHDVFDRQDMSMPLWTSAVGSPSVREKPRFNIHNWLTRKFNCFASFNYTRTRGLPGDARDGLPPGFAWIKFEPLRSISSDELIWDPVGPMGAL
jgi:hypothetical protein